MLRITSGELKGHPIRTLPSDKTRPTQARLRQALFNSLQSEIPGAKVLDLFAGSGALGFEALSRGAKSALLVESAKPAIRLIRQNIEELGLGDRARVLGESVANLWPKIRSDAPFDLVLADPPYAGKWEERLLRELPWGEILAPGGLFCLEWGVQKSVVEELPDQVSFLVKIRQKNYGDSVLTTYRRGEELQ